MKIPVFLVLAALLGCRAPLRDEPCAAATPPEAVESEAQRELHGRIVDHLGYPVADAAVALTRAWAFAPVFCDHPVMRAEDLHTTTDHDGRFRFTDLEPWNRYAVEVDAGNRKTLVECVAMGDVGSSHAPEIVLGAPPPGASPGSGPRLYGEVRDPQGDPIAGAAVLLHGPFALQDAAEAPETLTTESDDDGRYEFPLIPPGRYGLSVRAYGCAIVRIEGFVFRAGSIVERNITLVPAEEIRGRVVSREGFPVADAEVLTMSLFNSNRQCRDSCRTDELGAFRLERLEPGMYTVAVSAPGFRRGYRSRVRPGDPELVIELDRLEPIRGRVVAADTGRPVPLYSVRLRATNPGHTITIPLRHEHVFTEEDGRFSIDGIVSGTALVEAAAPGYAPSFSEPFEVLTGWPISGVSVRLTKGGSIAGTVENLDGDPVPRPRVTTHDPTWTASLLDLALGDEFPTNVTLRSIGGNAAGRFVIGDLRPGSYQVRVSAPGYCESIVPSILVEKGREASLPVTLLRGGEVRGEVWDERGWRIVRARIELRSVALPGELPRHYVGKPSGKGDFVLAHIHPGDYRIRVSRVRAERNTPPQEWELAPICRVFDEQMTWVGQLFVD